MKSLVEERVAGMDFRAIVEALRAILGARLTASIGNVGETRTVHGWVAGERQPSETTQQRLRHALVVAMTIAEGDGPGVAQAWFQGLNPQLENRSPARLLREVELDDVGPAVMAAARAALVGG